MPSDPPSQPAPTSHSSAVSASLGGASLVVVVGAVAVGIRPAIGTWRPVTSSFHAPSSSTRRPPTSSPPISFQACPCCRPRRPHLANCPAPSRPGCSRGAGPLAQPSARMPDQPSSPLHESACAPVLTDPRLLRRSASVAVCLSAVWLLSRSRSLFPLFWPPSLPAPPPSVCLSPSLFSLLSSSLFPSARGTFSPLLPSARPCHAAPARHSTLFRRLQSTLCSVPPVALDSLSPPSPFLARSRPYTLCRPAVCCCCPLPSTSERPSRDSPPPPPPWPGCLPACSSSSPLCSLARRCRRPRTP